MLAIPHEVAMKQVVLLFVLILVGSCVTNEPGDNEAPVGKVESPPGRSTEWLKEHCADCLGRGPKIRP